MGRLVKVGPGILFCALLAFISKYLANYLPLNSLTIGIILGILYSNIIGLQHPLRSGTKYTVKKLLKLGIILLGVDLDFVALYQAGPKIVILAVTVVSLGIFVAPAIGRRAGLNSKLATLLGVGSSICGASAIVAAAPLINADEDDTALSVALISLLGAVGVLVFPLLGNAFSFNDVQFGFWSGSSLQGVAHALAAAGSRSDLALKMATYVKMSRVVLIAPVSIYLGTCFTSQQGNKSKVNIPIYIVLFILVGIMASMGLFNFAVGSLTAKTLLKKSSKELILWSMIAMGLGVDFSKIKNIGTKATVASTEVFALISIVAGAFCLLAF